MDATQSGQDSFPHSPYLKDTQQLPWWLRQERTRDDGLPHHVTDRAVLATLNPHASVLVGTICAIIDLHLATVESLFVVRREHETKLDAMDPKVFVRKVLDLMRTGRDELLCMTAPEHVQLFAQRIDALIDATKVMLESLMTAPLDRIFGTIAKHETYGRLLLAGPWISAVDRAEDAMGEVLRLIGFAKQHEAPAASVDPNTSDRAVERAAEKVARVFGDGDNGDAKPKTLPAGGDESAGPALTVNQSRVLQTMAMFDASRLVSADAIAAEMDAEGRLSARTIGPIVRRLIELRLAERPEGDRSGARLTTAGRRLATKIAD